MPGLQQTSNSSPLINVDPTTQVTTGSLKTKLGITGSLYGYDTGLTPLGSTADLYPEGYVPPTNPLATKDSSLHYYKKLYKPGISVRGYDFTKITDADERKEAVKVIDNFVLYKDRISNLPLLQGSELDPRKLLDYSSPTTIIFDSNVGTNLNPTIAPAGYTGDPGYTYSDKIKRLKELNKI